MHWPIARFLHTQWPEAIGAFLAIAGTVVSVLSGFHVREWQSAASDFKTLYASALNFRQHLDPYSFHYVAAIFQQSHVVSPASWYGHAPVYPPFTLFLMAPLTLIPLVPAIYLWLAVSWIFLSVAVFLLTRSARETFQLSRAWRLLLLSIFAASPLVSFALEMCNVSVVVVALSIVAVLYRETKPGLVTINTLTLCLALLIKPHVALWIVAGLLVSRVRPDRSLALRSTALFACAGAAACVWMAAHHELRPVLRSYLAMVHQETAGGSMSASNHELVGVAAEITSLASLVGYWLTGAAVRVLSLAGLSILAGALCVLSLIRPETSERTRLLRLTAWSALGLIATYHRAHDGIILLLLLPYLLARLRQRRRDPFAWSFLALSAVLSIGPTWETYHWLATKPGLHAISNFMLYRQAPMAALLLLCLTMAELWRTVAPAHHRSIAAPESEGVAVAA